MEYFAPAANDYAWLWRFFASLTLGGDERQGIAQNLQKCGQSIDFFDAMAQAKALAPIERLQPSIFATSRYISICKSEESGCECAGNMICFLGNL